MSLFPSGAASFQPVISEVVNEVDRQEFVGARVLPYLPVDKRQGTFTKVLTAQFDNDASKPRAAGSNYASVSGEYESATFECLEYGLENPLDDIDIAQAETDAQLDIVAMAANLLADSLMVGHELRVAAALSGASFTSTAATAAMSAASTATPINDINQAVLRLGNSGITNNITLVIEASLYQEMLQTDDMRNLINGSGSMFWAQDQVAKVLGVNDIVIASTRYNSALKGQTGSRAAIWPTTSYYVLSVAGGQMSGGGVGRTLCYTDRGGQFVSETFRTEQPPANVIRVRNSCDEIILNANAGETITGA